MRQLPSSRSPIPITSNVRGVAHYSWVISQWGWKPRFHLLLLLLLLSLSRNSWAGHQFRVFIQCASFFLKGPLKDPAFKGHTHICLGRHSLCCISWLLPLANHTNFVVIIEKLYYFRCGMRKRRGLDQRMGNGKDLRGVRLISMKWCFLVPCLYISLNLVILA